MLESALEREAVAQRMLLDGDRSGAEAAFAEASSLYRRSWEEAPPGAYGRLAGMLKSAILASAGEEQAVYARSQIGVAETPAAALVVALAALVEGDREAARRAALEMHEGDDAFRRAGEAVEALAAENRARYAEAIAAIVRDFEGRSQYLTGVAIADTALVFERLAEARGLAARPDSELVPLR